MLLSSSVAEKIYVALISMLNAEVEEAFPIKGILTRHFEAREIGVR